MSHKNLDYSQIAPYIYIGTNLCCGAHGKTLKKLKIGADIDLEYERAETTIDDNVRNLNIHLWIPTRDHASPTLAQLKVGTATLNELVKSKIKTYVHCKNGHGRSPTLVSAYFIRQGMKIDEAVLRVAKKRPEIHLEPSQYEMLKKFKNYCNKLLAR